MCSSAQRGSRRSLVSAAFLLAAACGSAQAQLRVVTWNISNYNGTTRTADIQTAVYGTFNGRRMAPDVILAQEFATATALTTFVSALNTASGSPGDWVSAPFVTGPDSQSVCVFRSSKMSLVGNRTWTIATGSSSTSDQPRNTYRYDLRPVGYTSDSVVISMFSVHLKSGSASADNARRLIETTHIRDNTSGINTNGAGTAKPAAYQFLFGGDTNMQSATQTSYVQLIGSLANNAGRFFDPIKSPGSWNGSATFKYIHTQDPTGAGGMDDRHDQILMGAGLLDGVGIDYIGNPNATFSTTTWDDPNHSYRCWGNDGTSFNTTLTTTGNTNVGPTIAQALKNCATTAGGHLPVFADIRMPGKISAPASINFGTVAQGSTAQVTISVGNGGDTAIWNVAGLANIGYSMAASSGFTAPSGSFTDAPGGSLNSHTITMNTSTVGTKSGSITIASDDVDRPSLVIPITGFVQGANLPPIANAGAAQTVTDNDGNGSETVTLNGSASSDSDGTIVLYRWTEGANQLASSTTPTSNVSFPVGAHTVTLTVTDNGNATGTANTTVTVNPRPNQPPTANAGAPQTVTDTDGNGSEIITLNGSGSSDPDGTITNYTWKEGAITLASSANATSQISLPVGGHTITLIVTDNSNATATANTTVTVNPRPNQPPTANAGAPQTVTDTDGNGSEVVTLNGSGSSDPDGTITNYTWKEGAITLASSANATSQVSLPVGGHAITLTVTDNSNATATAATTVTVNPRPNQPPTANAGSAQTVVDADRGGDELITLDGSLSSDPDGTIVSYVWTEGAQTIATGVSPSALFATGQHLVTLTVTDNSNATATSTVSITVVEPCIADFNQDGGVDGTDVEAFFAAWETGDTSADANADGGVDGADVETFFIFWEQGGC